MPPEVPSAARVLGRVKLLPGPGEGDIVGGRKLYWTLSTGWKAGLNTPSLPHLHPLPRFFKP